MVDWNPLDPKAWARAHGLVSLPLFGTIREQIYPGKHAVLLDGERIGATFSVRDKGDLPPVREIQSWSWSSNLTHSFFIDETTKEIGVSRWDQPGEVEFHPLPPTRQRAANLLNSLEASDAPASTVVRKIISIFRVVRANIDRLRGTPTDAIHAFNAVLVWADAERSAQLASADVTEATTLRDVLQVIEAKRLAPFGPSSISAAVGGFLVHDLIGGLLERDPTTNYALDPDLLIRHAAGDLNQEAHIALARQPLSIQPTLFPVVSLDPTPAGGSRKSDAHFTPASLARALVEQAVLAIKKVRPLPKRIEVLDPASGSGVFLIESLRELGYGEEYELALRGFDTSTVSHAMTDFCLNRAVKEGVAAPVSIDVQVQDAIAPNFSWGQPDLILMNPPFAPWRSMSDPEKHQVKETLGGLYSGGPDKALAFLWKAICSLKPGAALGTLLPSPLLEGKAGLKLREAVEKESALTLNLVGRFRGLGYFGGVAVEPAFLVICRSFTPTVSRQPVTVVLAGRGDEDRAIRELRKATGDTTDPRGNWEVFSAPRDLFDPASWKPQTREAIRFIENLAAAGIPRVGDLFDLQLGIKTGNNDVFILSAIQMVALGMSATERNLFKPVAQFDTIRDGRIGPGVFVFYPYGVDGKPLFANDSQLQEAAPNYFRAYLQRHRAELENRKSLRKPRHWWELVEPRPTWQPHFEPKLISAVFTEPGKFAYDSRGEFCVVQGFAWIWKKPSFSSPDLPWAYLALMNSQYFAGVLDVFCPQVRAGQFDVYPHNVDKVFIPDLSDPTRVPKSLTEELATIGRLIGDGNKYDTDQLESAVSRAYSRPTELPAEIEERFQKLAERWREETGPISSVSKILKHPAYLEIIKLGEKHRNQVLSLILRELSIKAALWYEALKIIAKETPVTIDIKSDPKRVREAWLKWGREKRLIDAAP